MIYTIGRRSSYDKLLSEGKEPVKLGRYKGYSGGYAFKTQSDAHKRIIEAGYVGYGVYGLDANWGIHTIKSTDGWWHNLLNDALIIDLRNTDEDSRPNSSNV